MEEFENSDMRELKAAAFETLMFYPGSGREQWMSILLREYTEEVAAALGDNPDDVIADLNDMWHNMEYEDECTGIKKKYHQWAKVLVDRDAVDFYKTLVEKGVGPLEKK